MRGTGESRQKGAKNDREKGKRGVPVTEAQAKAIIMNDPKGDVIQRLEAIAVAESILGEECTMEEIWEWAERG